MKKYILFTFLCLAFLSNAQNGRIYDECNDISNITWIGNLNTIWDQPWSERQGDIYRFALTDKNNYAFLVYEMPEGKTVKSMQVDFYSPADLKPTFAVKNSTGTETKFVQEWSNGYPIETDLDTNVKRHFLEGAASFADATQAVIYLDANSDVEIMRVIVEYGDGYVAPEYNTNTDFSRVKKLMAKAEAGENITIGVIGGSMTAGANAEPMETNCYGARLKNWFETTYGIQVTLVNVGIGSTNSYYGAIRAEEQLLRYKPDLIVVEYACNDQDEDIYDHTYEGILRKLLKAPGYPAVVSTMFCTQAGITRQDRHLSIAQYYNLPVSSYCDVIKNEIIAGTKNWADYYATTADINGDGVHPNNAAHQKIADLIAELLTSVTADANVQLTALLPQPKNSAILEDAFFLLENDITPEKTGTWIDGDNNKWFRINPGGKGWRSNVKDSELIFDFKGDVVAVTYWRRPANENYGSAEIWVDNNAKVTVDSDGGHIDQLILTNLGSGAHKLHIKVLENKYFEISCIAVSGDREFFNASRKIRSYANQNEININAGNVTWEQLGSEFEINRTVDGYLTFKINDQYLAVNETDETIELQNTVTDAAKFLFVDKGKAFAFRSVLNSNYLSARNGLKASANSVTTNELFLLTDPAAVSINNGEIQEDTIIYGKENLICIENAKGKAIKIASIDGKAILNMQGTTDFFSATIPQGIYLVSVAEKTQKTVVY